MKKKLILSVLIFIHTSLIKATDDLNLNVLPVLVLLAQNKPLLNFILSEQPGNLPSQQSSQLRGILFRQLISEQPGMTVSDIQSVVDEVIPNDDLIHEDLNFVLNGLDERAEIELLNNFIHTDPSDFHAIADQNYEDDSFMNDGPTHFSHRSCYSSSSAESSGSESVVINFRPSIKPNGLDLVDISMHEKEALAHHFQSEIEKELDMRYQQWRISNNGKPESYLSKNTVKIILLLKGHTPKPLFSILLFSDI